MAPLVIMTMKERTLFVILPYVFCLIKANDINNKQEQTRVEFQTIAPYIHVCAQVSSILVIKTREGEVTIYCHSNIPHKEGKKEEKMRHWDGNPDMI